MLHAVLLLSLVSASAAHGAIYRCDIGGVTTFSGTPCGDGAQQIQLNTEGNRLAPPPATEKMPGTPAAPEESAAPDEGRRNAPCRHISSTRLRTLIIREEAVRGMTRDQVREARGEPDAIYSQPLEMWTYDLREDERIFPVITRVQRIYFRQGCVSDIRYVEP